MTDKYSDAGHSSREWKAPKLERLGTLRDIALGPTPLTQAANSKKS